jgi:hypothetical protein
MDRLSLRIEMTQFNACIASFSRIGSRATRLGLVAAVGLAAGSAASAQAFRADAPGLSMMVKIEAPASDPETVRLLVGLGRINADLQLGLLFLGDGLTSPDGSHFSHPRKEIWPGLKDGLFAAGVPDLEPLLQKLEAGGSKDAVTAAYLEAKAALLKARSTLNPSAQDAALAVLELTKAAAAEINAAGPTEVKSYQIAWALLMAARGELDLLARNPDPAMAKMAATEGMAIDDMIISMPDPNQVAPVAFDPTPILDLIGRLAKIEESV